MNKNFTQALINFENDMLQVRGTRQLYNAIEDYFETCFMQVHEKSEFRVHGTIVQLLIDDGDDRIQIGYLGLNHDPVAIRLQAGKVIDIELDMQAVRRAIKHAKSDDETEIVADALYWLFEKMQEYFRVM